MLLRNRTQRNSMDGWLSKLLSIGCLALISCSAANRQQTTVADLSPFTVVVLPDTQRYSEEVPELFFAQTEWIRENAHEQNIVLVSHVGDIVEHGGEVPQEWRTASEAMALLDGICSWGVAPGNHDYDLENDRLGRGEVFKRYFGNERFSELAWYGGVSPSGLSSYQFFNAGGQRFIIIHLECDAPDEAIAWARDILAQHRGCPAIVSTHVYLDGRNVMGHDPKPCMLKNGNSGQAIWEKLVRKEPQIFMVFCGHQGRPGEFHQISTNDAGGQVIELLADYQKRPRGGDGWLRLVRFEPTGNTVQIETYSPALDQYETDADSRFTVPLVPPLFKDATATRDGKGRRGRHSEMQRTDSLLDGGS